MSARAARMAVWRRVPVLERIADLLPAIYPLSMIAGLVGLSGGGPILRAGLVLSALPGLLHVRGVTRVERAWFGILLIYLGAISLSALAASDPDLALGDLERQVFLASVVVGLTLALSVRSARGWFAVAALVTAVTSVGVILSVYGSFAGVPLLGPAQASFKQFAASRFDIPINAISFAALIAMVLAIPVLARRRILLVVLLIPLGAALAASGSRTSELSLLIAIPLSVGGIAIAAIRFIPRWIPTAAIGVVTAWACLTFAAQLGEFITSPALNDLTTGRSLLWIAGARMFADRPWFGWGGDSFSSELGRYLPGVQAYQAGDLKILETGGGAHNAFITILAERGIVGGLAAILFAGFMVWLAVRLFGDRHRLTGSDLIVARLAPFAVVLVLSRSLGELPGWFGYADSLVDFLAYALAAMLVAVAASLERSRQVVDRARP